MTAAPPPPPRPADAAPSGDARKVGASARGQAQGPEAPLVSVIIPCFNVGAFLGESLAQLADQSFRDFETIVVDDGSDPAEAEALARMVSQAGFILLRQPNGGPGVARNRGAAAARGRYLAFLDVDDLWLPHKLARQAQAVVADPTLDLVFHHTETITDGEVRALNCFGALTAKGLEQRLIEGRLHSFTSALFLRKAWFDAIGGFDPALRFREDHLLLLRALREGRWLCLGETLSRRRLHHASMSSSARHPDPAVHLGRAELFLDAVTPLYPDVRKRPAIAHELRRIARHHIVLGHRGQAARYCLRAAGRAPVSMDLVRLLGALALSWLQPARFDHWHPDLAKLRASRSARRPRLSLRP